jgi:hypothetical protein
METHRVFFEVGNKILKPYLYKLHVSYVQNVLAEGYLLSFNS